MLDELEFGPYSCNHAGASSVVPGLFRWTCKPTTSILDAFTDATRARTGAWTESLKSVGYDDGFQDTVAVLVPDTRCKRLGTSGDVPYLDFTEAVARNRAWSDWVTGAELAAVATHLGRTVTGLQCWSDQSAAAFTTLIANVPFVAVVNAAVPVSNIKGLVTYAANKPISFGSAGNGSVNHLLGEMFNTASGAKMQHVPYKGAAPALTDLISGQIQVVFTSLPSVAQHIRGGTVKGLAVTGSKRASAFKDIPTIAESGFPGFVINPWFGLFASKGTPMAVARQINADVKKVLEEKDVQDRFAALGAEPFESTPQELQAMLHADIKTWAAVVKSSGATAD